MQEREHDALPLPGSSTANALSGNPFLVAATLTAIFLAGSAMVYRNRPQLGYNSSGREQAPSRRVLVVSANVDGKEAVHGGLEEKPAGSRDADNAAKPANDFEQKEGKTARSKDRRRRGKDPLKEILKSGKKLKGFDTSTVSSPKPTPTKPTHAQRASVDEADEVGPPSPSTSALPSESIAITETLHGSLSRNAGKRAQRENSRASNGDATLPSAGSTSAGHSRGTSEVSQSRRQESSVELLSPSQSHSVLSSHSSHEHHRSQPTCDRPQSPAASVSEDGGRAERSRSRGRARRPALEEGGETSERESLAIGRAHEARLAGDQRETASTIPSPAMAYNNSSSNSSCAGSMTTAASLSMTPATSPTLSQTSSLSKSAPSLAQPTSDANQNSSNPDFTQHQKLNPGLSSPSPIPSNSQSSRNIRSTSKSTTNDSLPSSSSIDTPHTLTATGSTPTASGSDSPMKTKNGSRKASTQLGATHSSVANNGKAKSNQAPSPWDWDGAGVDVAAPESSSSSTTSPVMPAKTNEKEKESYKKPPRLQGKASANSTYSSFSAVAAAVSGRR
ncbi:hypothetical protein NLJ89_g11127 [Agrocybe chaxingu]|uniref:Uncharacterized protein n=1 Tax=Agrocybe chaxingu TaxID=84603 RepID=A0A9W8MNA5_9AGAR|nr:hypothetical protein NLJ89_g11127 [Agrocybe chaxingu]